MSFLTSLFGDPNKRIINAYRSRVDQINVLGKKYTGFSLERLQEALTPLRERLTKGETVDDILPDAFAITREAADQSIHLRHFDVQLIGGLVLHEGNIAEMRTGEGKTLVATLPAALNALTGNGVHIVTVNDYLAKRDTVWMGPVYHGLGLSVACIQHESAFLFDPTFTKDDERMKYLRPVTRKEAYAADITYGTNNEFGFDYLRDNMVPSISYEVQRGHHFAIVDEVDSILIDEARTPLIISAPDMDSSKLYGTFARLVGRLSEDQDYNIDEKMRAVTLTEGGIQKVEQALGIANIYEAEGIETVHHVEQALKAKALFHRDRDYVVKDGEVVIVDEFTGRLMFGRRYSEGLHQAIEAKEGVEVKQESRTLATITFQNYFRLYKKLSGMTGTAATEAEEFAKIYSLETVQIPTHRPMVRTDLSDRVYKNETGKFQAIAREIKARHELGQPVLVGTISIKRNELLTELLQREGISCNVLNAKNHEHEAEIIAQAGRRAAVTVATNMAGRGVDIILGGTPASPEEAEEVRKLGGLHVIGTERHESRRIDNQLRGRSGRQGDAGSSQFYVSMEDDLMRIFGSDRMKGMMERLGVPDDMPIENRLISKSIESAQKKVEGHNFDIRKHLVEYDDVINKHREVVYALRRNILQQQSDNAVFLKEKILELVEKEIEQVISFHTAAQDESTWDFEEIYQVVDSMFPVSLDARIRLEDMRAIAGDTAQDVTARTKIIQYIVSLSQTAYAELEKRVGDTSTMQSIERAIYLRAIDLLWVEHLDLIDHLRQGIGLRGYAQLDPLVEYKKEAYRLFTELMNNIQKQVVYTVFKVGMNKTVAQSPIARQMPQASQVSSSAAQFEHASSSSVPPQERMQEAQPEPQYSRDVQGNKVGRNDPCPCGSGKKYKKCHGK